MDQAGRPFLFAAPEPVQIDLHHIDQDAAGEIQSATETATPAARDRYLLRSIIEEAITSSQLEGASTTRRVAAEMLRSGRAPNNRSEQMILNNYLAMRTIREWRDAPLTPARILEIHRMVSDLTLDDPKDVGRLRQSNDIHVVNNDDGSILHQPPDYRELPERLQRICAFANAGEAQRPFVHPVLRAILRTTGEPTRSSIKPPGPTCSECWNSGSWRTPGRDARLCSSHRGTWPNGFPERVDWHAAIDGSKLRISFHQETRDADFTGERSNEGVAQWKKDRSQMERMRMDGCSLKPAATAASAP
jgi:hypothetical protein